VEEGPFGGPSSRIVKPERVLGYAFLNRHLHDGRHAILVDATIVRAVLLPATMKLLGDWNWYLPSWLQWPPRLQAGEATAP